MIFHHYQKCYVYYYGHVDIHMSLYLAPRCEDECVLYIKNYAMHIHPTILIPNGPFVRNPLIEVAVLVVYPTVEMGRPR